MWNVYRDYLGLNFNKVHWSKLVPIHIDIENGVEIYKCDCCNKYPHECNNKASAIEYDKIRQIVDKDYDAFGVSEYIYPIKQTGYLRADQHPNANLIWKVQRELASRAGFQLIRSDFW